MFLRRQAEIISGRRVRPSLTGSDAWLPTEGVGEQFVQCLRNGALLPSLEGQVQIHEERPDQFAFSVRRSTNSCSSLKGMRTDLPIRTTLISPALMRF